MTKSIDAAVASVFSGTPRQPKPQSANPVEGSIISVEGQTAMFIVPSYDGGKHSWGPAPFGRTSTPPQAGDRCLVVFAGNTISKPWIVSWTDAS